MYRIVVDNIPDHETAQYIQELIAKHTLLPLQYIRYENQEE